EEENQQASKGAQVITSSSYSICGEIVDYLNKQIGTRYKPTTPKTQRLIRARLREGFTLEDFKRVIDKKCAAWRADAEMCRYLRPETLFGTKFESYLNEPEKEDWQE
ncbi:MAG: conserved phage C-terminal domain-containing protein, partial [Thermodesulfovibrionales bacterium]